MTDPETTRPVVLIVGAGLGGLALGALLEKAGVPYAIFERSPVSNPVGSAIALSAGVMPMFKQLGIYDELTLVSKPLIRSRTYNGKGRLVMDLDMSTGIIERFSFMAIILGRPALYEILLKQIPKNKIHFGKRVLSHGPTDNGVVLRFSDNSTVEGSLLVGADGANSAVRQNLYKQLDKTEVLPASDRLPLKYSSIALVGQTKTLDPEEFVALKSKECFYEIVLGDKTPFVAAAFPTAQNTICWLVVEFLDKESSKLHDSFRNSEWGPEAAAEMAKREEVCAPKFPGLNMSSIGDLVELTLKELMSKVMLEEKVFKTWAHGRTVLLGDACHKMTPAAGQGALNAMLDALVLANHIETLRGNNAEDIAAACKAYQDERYSAAKSAVDASAITTLTTKNGLVGDIFRFILHNAPQWLWDAITAKAGEYRPQVAFLPPFEDHGSVKPLHQPSLHRPGSTRSEAVSAVDV